ncbi:MAG: PilZ domain-containing protein [Planctomycetota bacterium]
MLRWPHLYPEPRKPDPDQARRSGRVSTDCIRCDLGKVVDLSAGGLCLQGGGPKPGKKGEKITFRLDAGVGIVQFTGEIVRIGRRGLFGWEAGLRFVDLNATQKKALSRMAMSAAAGEITEWQRAS